MLRHTRTACKQSSTSGGDDGINVCDVCRRSFSTRHELIQHTRTVRCDPEGPPSPKRRVSAVASNDELVEDPLEAPFEYPIGNDLLSDELLRVVRQHWVSIRTSVSRGPVQSRYNYRLTTLDTRDLEQQLRRVFDEQNYSFKINLSYGFVLRNKNTGRYRYFHSSFNCCGRYLDEPSLVTNSQDFETFLQRIRLPDVLQWVGSQRPDSAWVVEIVTNATFFINKIIDHPIGCVNTILPPYLKRNKAVITLERDQHNKRYNDNLCLFRCLALHRGANVRRLEPSVAQLYADYGADEPMHEFAGVLLEDLHHVETTFSTNISVYTLAETKDGKTVAELVRRSMCHYPETMTVNLHGTHFSYIQDPQQYCHSYRCRKCGNSLWKRPYLLLRHERSCQGGVRHVYPGGVYHPTPSIFQRLDDEGIRVEDELRYYPYRATYDFECYFDSTELPPNCDKVQWVARHVPLSVSIASNVPGHEDARCYVTDGDSETLIATMMKDLERTSDAAFEMLKPRYKRIFDELEELRVSWDNATSEGAEEEEEEAEEGEGEEETVSPQQNNPYSTLTDQLLVWINQMPVIGFNSGRYDLNTIKQFMVPYLLLGDGKETASCFVIKRRNTFMCLSTSKLKFLDMVNYLAPGFSYDKYLKAYGCDLTKGHFPYEYMDDIRKLDDRNLPPKEAFYSRLKNEGITNEAYVACERVWREKNMQTMRDFLVWYNNLDVVPFLEAISKQTIFYQQRGIDMFKDGISVPGLTLLYLFNDLPANTYFTLFSEKHKDLHRLVKEQIVGGPAIIFHRYHEKDVTSLREVELGEAAQPCRSVVGYDANALYLWALMQDMPTGWFTRRREQNGFRPESAQLYGQMAAEWLTWEASRTGHAIRHQLNGREKRIPVDGWCRETRTAYQFHGCFFHGCPCVGEEVNTVNGKPMAQLREETRKYTAYLRRYVKVVEMWECTWKQTRKAPAVKQLLDTEFPRRRGVIWELSQQQILDAVCVGTLFGLVECDIRVPENLRQHFAEMLPVFKNTTVSRDDIGPFMRQYARNNDIMSTPRRMLVGSYHGEKILLATPLLQWYLAHGLVVEHVYQIIEFQPNPCFRRFGESVSTARRKGDSDPNKTIIADTMKLLGNSGYGKTVTDVDRHRDVQYCTEVGASMLINNRRFHQLDVVVDNAYEVEMEKKVIKYSLPHHIGFFVYQYAKLRMLQFYYDFVDKYIERPLYQYCEMDTDSAYIALAGNSLDDLVSEEKRSHYFRHRSEWLPAESCTDHNADYVRCRLANRPWNTSAPCCLARKAYDKRTPGLFKVEWHGSGFVGLCSKTYYCFGSADKYSTKGLSKRHNEINKDTFLEVLTNQRSGCGWNRGFRVIKSSVLTYIQERAALTYFYAKREVLADGLTTAPLDV